MSEIMTRTPYSAEQLSGKRFICQPAHAKVLSEPNGQLTVLTGSTAAEYGVFDQLFRLPRCTVYDVYIKPVSLSIPLRGSFSAQTGRIVNYTAVMNLTAGPSAHSLIRFVKNFGGQQVLSTGQLAAELQGTVQSCVDRSILIRSQKGLRPLVELDFERNKALFETLEKQGVRLVNSYLSITSIT